MADEMCGPGQGCRDAHGGAMMVAGVVTGGGCGNCGEACCSVAEGSGASVGSGLIQGYLVLAMRKVNRVERKW